MFRIIITPSGDYLPETDPIEVDNVAAAAEVLFEEITATGNGDLCAPLTAAQERGTAEMLRMAKDPELQSIAVLFAGYTHTVERAS